MCLKSDPKARFKDDASSCELCVEPESVTEEASSRFTKNGRIAGRERAGGRWD